MQGDGHPSKLALRERREQAIARLTESFARDELGLEAFERRIEAAYCCDSVTECDALVADLRRAESSEADAMVVAKAELVRNEPSTDIRPASVSSIESRPILRALFSNIERCDDALMPRASRIEAVFGNVEVDLRKATFAPGVTEIGVRAVFGSIEIVVPADVTVEVGGAAVFGHFEGATRTTADPDAPAIRIVGSATFASVVVRTLPPLRVQKRVEQIRARRLLPP
ncbi:MAG: LiaF domain-containing protein [Polyangiaceae bacterium]|jgi:hypothetical protein